MLGFLRQREKPVAETWGLKLGDAHKPSERELKENSCVAAATTASRVIILLQYCY
eukprot:COSAG06_NODE_4065_length_4611_cov_2.104388_6_plen_55_part_00